MAAGNARAEDRILWYSVGDGLTNQTNVQAAIDFAVANKFNGICVLARYRANAYYIPNRDINTYSNPEPRGSSTFDTLQYVLDRAHEVGLRVYISFSCFLVTSSSTYPAFLPSGSIMWVYKDVAAPVASNDTTYSPDAGYPRAMTTADDSEGLWADVGRADVRTHTRNVFKDIVANYDIDGVFLDRVRYPGDSLPHRSSAFGYNPQALTEMGLTNPAPGATAFNTARRNAVTQFCADIGADLRSLKPWVIYSSVPIVYSTTLNSTYNSVFQYFPDWNSRVNPDHVSGYGIFDHLAPQYYRSTAAANTTLIDLVNAAVDETTRMYHLGCLSPGYTDAAEMAQLICNTRGRAMKGFGFFSYGSTSAAGYMSTLNSTSTSGCGTGIMSSTSPKTDYTLKVNWDSIKPNNITNLSADTSQLQQVTLNWSTPAAASDGDVPVRYLVYRSKSTPVKLYYSNLVNRSYAVTGNSFVDSAATGLESDTWYYKVIPVDNYNNKGDCNQVGPVIPVFPQVFVESRTSAGGVTASPQYVESGGLSNTTSKSSAAGLVGSGARYCTTVGNKGTFQPPIASMGLYNVYVTLDDAASGPNNNARTNWRIYRPGRTDVTGSVHLYPGTPGLANNWLLLASNVIFPQGAAGSAGGIEFTNLGKDASFSGDRFCMDAVKFTYTGPVNADLGVSQFASSDPVAFGSAVTYSVTVTNSGPQTATGVVVVNTVPQNVTMGPITVGQGSQTMTGDSIIWNVGTLANGASATMTITVTPQFVGTLTNIATSALEETDPNSANNSSTVNTAVVCYGNCLDVDTFDTADIQPPGSAGGWSVMGQNDPAIVEHDHDAVTGAYRIRIHSAVSRHRLSGWTDNRTEWLPYSSVGASNYVRGKYYIYAQGDPAFTHFNQIPNVRLRLANRFAVTADLHIVAHSNSDPTNDTYAQELRPSTDPANPSLYRIDFDPIDVPYLSTSTSGEGIMRGFDVFTLDAQDNGYIAMTECALCVYPKSALSDATALMTKIYQPSATDAGGLKIFNSATDIDVLNYVPPDSGLQGDNCTVERSGGLSTYTEGTFGVTLDSTAVPSNRIGFITRNFYAGGSDGSAAYTSRIRAAEDQVYKIRWHITSTRDTSQQAWLWLQHRAIKFAYIQTLSLAGGFGSNGYSNQAVARQSTPGVGCLNPEQNTPGESGGWYTVILNTPMSPDIRPEFDPSTPLSTRMPNICALPGPGVNSASNRDVKVAAQIYDTVSQGSGKDTEAGVFTIDRIEVTSHRMVED